MKNRMLSITCLLLFISIFSYSQQEHKNYAEYIQEAETFYNNKEYNKSALAYSKAFMTNGGKATIDDRYNAACLWALVGEKDSAFYHLKKLAENKNFVEYDHMVIDPDLNTLHTDKRWIEICAMVKKHKDDTMKNLNKKLVAKLDTVFQNDQKYRLELDVLEKKYTGTSKEKRDLWQVINYHDSINLIIVENIISKYGWLGPDKIGRQGNQTLFLVIQHADIKTQKQYLPIMRQAVKEKKALPSEFALLEDRVALREGKKQIYGSQIRGDINGHFWVAPLIDPDNVDKRRAEVGLEPLADYVKQWNMIWDLKEYKKDLPEFEKKEWGK